MPGRALCVQGEGTPARRRGLASRAFSARGTCPVLLPGEGKDSDDGGSPSPEVEAKEAPWADQAANNVFTAALGKRQVLPDCPAGAGS